MLFVYIDCVYVKLGYYQKSTFVLLGLLSTPTLGTAGCPLVRYTRNLFKKVANISEYKLWRNKVVKMIHIDNRYIDIIDIYKETERSKQSI